MQALDDGVPLFRMRTLSQAVLDARWNSRVSARLAETVSLLAILLATIGLYAVTAHGVALRTREIGLRMALGARPWQVVQVVLRAVRVPLVLGFALAVIGSMLWDRAFSVGVADARAADPRLLLVVTAAVATITVVACFVPARRASADGPGEGAEAGVTRERRMQNAECKMQKGGSMLSVTGLTKTYGGVLALRDLSFTAAPGQVVGLLGPNGSGKSTTINILTGLLHPTRGQVCWNGDNIQSDLKGYQSRLGYVPEEPRLYPYLTAPPTDGLDEPLRGAGTAPPHASRGQLDVSPYLVIIFWS
jgi:ABC-type multidrug transport system fused ATPase/permease subunit